MVYDTDLCMCGHVADEHAPNGFCDPAECTVDGCDCAHFELDEGEDDAV